jgi:hypothetical protein
MNKVLLEQFGALINWLEFVGCSKQDIFNKINEILLENLKNSINSDSLADVVLRDV